VLAASGVRIIMDSKGRYLDNIFIERLWRSLKYEDIYIKAYASVPEAPWHRRLAEVLQRRAPASGPGLSDAMRSVPGGAILWIRGQRHRVDHIPTRPSSAARKGSNWNRRYNFVAPAHGSRELGLVRVSLNPTRIPVQRMGTTPLGQRLSASQSRGAERGCRLPHATKKHFE
jgi:transposase InsO family protein